MLYGIGRKFGGQEAQIVEEIYILGGLGTFDNEPPSRINPYITNNVRTTGKPHLADHPHVKYCHFYTFVLYI